MLGKRVARVTVVRYFVTRQRERHQRTGWPRAPGCRRAGFIFWKGAASKGRFPVFEKAILPSVPSIVVRLNPTSPTLYFNNALGRVYHCAPDYVCLDWQDAPMTRGDLRAVYEHTLHLLKRTGLRKVLSDHRLMPTYTPEDRDWLLRDWVPRAVAEAGYSHCAVVQAHDVFNHKTTRGMAADVHQKTTLTVQYFDRLDPAVAWLLSQ